MREISTETLTDGMVIAKNVYSKRNQLILQENSVLTRQMIAHLKYYQITSVSVVEGEIPKPAKEAILRKDEAAKSSTERLIQSALYKKFKKQYDLQIEIVKDSLNDIILKNAPIDQSNLISETSSFFDANPATSSILEMLHHMHQLDDSTYAHSVNVAIISRLLGTWIGMDQLKLNDLTLAGLLHDIGKCQIPEDILLKPGKLSKQEYEFIKLHPQFGYDIIKDRDIDAQVKSAVLQHHERFDGSGYPLRLSGEEIVDFASIISIADVYDAMTSNRCYRSALCPFDVIATFEEEGLNRYNPKYILVFLERIANSYVNSDILLSNNSTGKIIFITNKLTRPVVQLHDRTIIDLKDYPDLYIEAIV